MDMGAYMKVLWVLFIALGGILLASSIALAMSGFQMPFAITSAERASPSDWIREEQIKVYPHQIIIDLDGAIWAGFTDTNSMDPFIDADAHAIEILPKDPSLIKAGDVVAYDSPYGVIIHRVVEVGLDEQGTYYRLKGDNSTLVDPTKVRFDDVRGVVVAVIY